MADPGTVSDRNLILDGLKKNGVSPSDVTHVFISHHHPDHGTHVFTHLWWAPDKYPEKDPIAWDHKKLDESRKKVDAIADWIIPGHGKMFSNRKIGEE